MARVLVTVKHAAPGQDVYNLGTCEAGGTLEITDVGTLRINRLKYNALTAGEKTAFGAQTIATLLALAFQTRTES